MTPENLLPSLHYPDRQLDGYELYHKVWDNPACSVKDWNDFCNSPYGRLLLKQEDIRFYSRNAAGIPGSKMDELKRLYRSAGFQDWKRLLVEIVNLSSPISLSSGWRNGCEYTEIAWTKHHEDVKLTCPGVRNAIGTVGDLGRYKGCAVDYEELYLTFAFTQVSDLPGAFLSTHRLHQVVSSLSQVFDIRTNEFLTIANDLRICLRWPPRKGIEMDEQCSQQRAALDARASIQSPSYASLDDHLSNIGLTDIQIDGIRAFVKSSQSRISSHLDSSAIIGMKTPSYHTVLRVPTYDGRIVVLKMSNHADSANIEQAASYYLPQAGLAVVSSGIPVPFEANGVFITISDYRSPAVMAGASGNTFGPFLHSPTYYIRKLAEIHERGRQVLESAGVAIPSLDLPASGEIYDALRFSRGRHDINTRMLRERIKEYDEAQHLLSAGSQCLTHVDLKLQNIIDGVFGDAEHFCVASPALGLAGFFYDPLKGFSNDEIGSLLAEYRAFQESNQLQGFAPVSERLMSAAKLVRGLLSLKWNAENINTDPINAPGKIQYWKSILCL